MVLDLRKLNDTILRSLPSRREANEAFTEALRLAAKTDLLAYGLYVHGHESPVLRKLAFARHTHVLASLMDKHKNTLFVTPPEHGKSTLMRWEAEMYIGNETELSFEDPGYPPPAVLYVMNTEKQVVSQSQAIGYTLEHNGKFKALFPHVKPDKPSGWTKDSMFLRRPYFVGTPSVMVSGLFGPYQGLRFTRGYADDALDPEDVNSPTRLGASIDRRVGMFDDRFAEGSVVRDILTRWSMYDMYSVLSLNPRRRCEVMPALGYWADHPEYGMGDEEALWPDLWPVSRIAEKRRDRESEGKSALFQITYLCNPAVAEGSMFKREWFRYADPPAEEKEEEVAV